MGGADPELLERDAELGVLRDRLRAARDGTGGVVLVEGHPGLGKSELLRRLRAEALTEGLQVRAATGAALEREFGFGVVRQLLEPVVRTAPPELRDELLAGAAALAAPALGFEATAEPVQDASFATLHGLYWLTAALTERRPLLLVVDDAHWADEPSLRFCDFLARRAPDLPLLLAVGLRPDEPGAALDLLAGLAEAPGAEVLHPGLLSTAATARLVADGLGDAPAPDVVASAHAATGGNPLLLRELVRTLAGWDGEPSAEVVRAAVPSSVTRSVQRRLRRLEPAAQELAAALAVLGERVPRDVLAAAAGVGPQDADAALSALGAAALTEGEPPRFVHPLLRQAVAEAVAPARRTALHGRAADGLRTRRGAEEQVVVHLLAAPPRGEPWVVAHLRAAAARAQAEGAPDLAVRRLERALEELPTGDPATLGLVLELGLAEFAAGAPGAVVHLRQAMASSDPLVAAGALAAQLSVGMLMERELLVPALDRVRELAGPGTPLSPEVADELLAVALSASTQDPGLAPQRAELLAASRERGGLLVTNLLAHDAAATGATADDARELLQEAVRRSAGTVSAASTPSLAWSVSAACSVDAPEEARRLVDAMTDAARRASSLLLAAVAEFMRGWVEVTFGSAAAGEAHLRSAHERLAGAGVATVERPARAGFVLGLVAVGRLDEAEALTREVPDDDFGAKNGFNEGTWLEARSALRHAQGRHAEAVVDLRRLAEIRSAWGFDRHVIGYGAARLARCLVALGELEEGRTLAAAEVAEARRRGVASHEALASIALGHALEGEAALAAFAAAAAAGERTPALGVRATALLEHGAALRRAGQRAAARTVLAAARDVAHRAGAAAVLAAATDELAVAGGRPQRVALSGVDALTPSERRMAEHAARGLTNREIAETLFVTRKTVESTLGNVFLKLDIRSRTQLPGLVGPPG